MKLNAGVAQLVEQLICNQVAGSSPIASSSAGVAQLVEHQPSKLNVVGSRPIARSNSTTDHQVCRQGVLLWHLDQTPLVTFRS